MRLVPSQRHEFTALRAAERLRDELCTDAFFVVPLLAELKRSSPLLVGQAFDRCVDESGQGIDTVRAAETERRALLVVPVDLGRVGTRFAFIYLPSTSALGTREVRALTVNRVEGDSEAARTDAPGPFAGCALHVRQLRAGQRKRIHASSSDTNS
jgi:hypothetical protein